MIEGDYQVDGAVNCHFIDDWFYKKNTSISLWYHAVIVACVNDQGLGPVLSIAYSCYEIFYIQYQIRFRANETKYFITWTPSGRLNYFFASKLR